MRIQLDNSTYRFFERKMSEHNKVASFTRLSIPEYAIFKLERTTLADLHVHLSDAYFYTRADYIGRPSIIGEGDCILIARPEAGFDQSLVQEGRRDGIGIGSFAKLMGALNYNKVCEYVSR